MEVNLQNLGTVNKNLVSLKHGVRQINLYFSYETIVAVNQYVSVNDWSVTTGKLLNELQPDKKQRIPHKEVLDKAQELIKALLEGD